MRNILLLVLAARLFAAAPPQAEITNGVLNLKVYLPDAATGYYRATRFDWSGMIGALEYRGHHYYGPWFQRTDPAVHDFTYDADEIVAGPCTAAVGPAEEFLTDDKALGFDNALSGGTFVKIGVGVLRRPDERAYDRFRLYEIADPGKWTTRVARDTVEFAQELNDRATGYGYVYRKKLRLIPGAPEMVLEHSIHNTGRRAISSFVYNHNFLTLDGQAPGPDFAITVPFQIQETRPLDSGLAEIRGHSIFYRKVLEQRERVMVPILGFGSGPADYNIRVENRKSGAGVLMTGDRPLANLVLWSIRTVVSVEPFIKFTVNPGETFTWRITYRYF